MDAHEQMLRPRHCVKGYRYNKQLNQTVRARLPAPGGWPKEMPAGLPALGRWPKRDAHRLELCQEEIGNSEKTLGRLEWGW